MEDSSFAADVPLTPTDGFTLKNGKPQESFADSLYSC